MKFSSRFIVALVVATLCWAVNASAEWRVDIETKTVSQNETGVTVAITAYWDIELNTISIPIIVRSVTAGAFWMAPLPLDTAGVASVGVQWNWSNPGWALLREEVNPKQLGCDPEGDIGYDGSPPDHFLINAATVTTGTPAEPDGREILILTFNVNGHAGDFEFDTACYFQMGGVSLDRIFMIDNVTWEDHGPGSFTNEDFDGFNKGVITIQDGSGILESSDDNVPSEYTLSQNYPNPFNASTQIKFSLEYGGLVKLEIFNILGEKVATPVDNEYMGAGQHSTNWDGTDTQGKAVASGMYFYRLTAGDFAEMKKMVLMK